MEFSCKDKVEINCQLGVTANNMFWNCFFDVFSPYSNF